MEIPKSNPYFKLTKPVTEENCPTILFDKPNNHIRVTDSSFLPEKSFYTTARCTFNNWLVTPANYTAEDVKFPIRTDLIPIDNDTIIAEDGVIKATAQVPNLVAGDNVSITSSTAGLVISATDTTYIAGSGIDITGSTISVDTTVVQEKLSAGEGISITGSTISSTVTVPTYGAGDNISITAGTLTDYIISSTDTTYSAGTGISITGNTVNVKNDDKTIVTNASGELETAVGGWVEKEAYSTYVYVSNFATISMPMSSTAVQSAFSTITYNQSPDVINLRETLTGTQPGLIRLTWSDGESNHETYFKGNIDINDGSPRLTGFIDIVPTSFYSGDAFPTDWANSDIILRCMVAQDRFLIYDRYYNTRTWSSTCNILGATVWAYFDIYHKINKNYIPITAGNNVEFTGNTGGSIIINAANTTYSAGNNIEINANNQISVNKDDQTIISDSGNLKTQIGGYKEVAYTALEMSYIQPTTAFSVTAGTYTSQIMLDSQDIASYTINTDTDASAVRAAAPAEQFGVPGKAVLNCTINGITSDFEFPGTYWYATNGGGQDRFKCPPENTPAGFPITWGTTSANARTYFLIFLNGSRATVLLNNSNGTNAFTVNENFTVNSVAIYTSTPYDVYHPFDANYAPIDNSTIVNDNGVLKVGESVARVATDNGQNYIAPPSNMQADGDLGNENGGRFKDGYFSGIIKAANLPSAPSADGTYVLTCTISQGEASYSWATQS